MAVGMTVEEVAGLWRDMLLDFNPPDCFPDSYSESESETSEPSKMGQLFDGDALVRELGFSRDASMHDESSQQDSKEDEDDEEKEEEQYQRRPSQRRRTISQQRRPQRRNMNRRRHGSIMDSSEDDDSDEPILRQPRRSRTLKPSKHAPRRKARIMEPSEREKPSSVAIERANAQGQRLEHMMDMRRDQDNSQVMTPEQYRKNEEMNYQIRSLDAQILRAEMEIKKLQSNMADLRKHSDFSAVFGLFDDRRKQQLKGEMKLAQSTMKAALHCIHDDMDALLKLNEMVDENGVARDKRTLDRIGDILEEKFDEWLNCAVHFPNSLKECPIPMPMWLDTVASIAHKLISEFPKSIQCDCLVRLHYHIRLQMKPRSEESFQRDSWDAQ